MRFSTAAFLAVWFLLSGPVLGELRLRPAWDKMTLPAVGGEPVSRTLADRSSSMGEIRVRVKITNAIDEMRLRRGEITAAAVRTCEAVAVVNTRVVRSVISLHVHEQLGARERARQVAGPFVFDIFGQDTVDEALVAGDQVVIGSTVVDKLDLRIDSTNQRLIPNPAHPDQPVSMVR
jgi:hypothetical protein